MNNQAHEINICRGGLGRECRFSLPADESIGPAIEALLDGAGWPEFLADMIGQTPAAHNRLKINIAACANGCSRPHIADIGLIRVLRPQVNAGECLGCGICAESCPDRAVSMAGELPRINPDLCLDCGYCVKTCPEQALGRLDPGWRVIVGGRLGRRPKLGTPLPGILTTPLALGVVQNAITTLMRDFNPGIRFGQILDGIETNELLRNHAK